MDSFVQLNQISQVRPTRPSKSAECGTVPAGPTGARWSWLAQDLAGNLGAFLAADDGVEYDESGY